MFCRFPLIRQHSSADCALACLKMILKYYNMNDHIDENDYLYYISKDGISLASVVEIAEKSNFEVACGKIYIDQLHEAQLPCILYWNHNHFVVLYKIKKYLGQYFFYIADPAKGLRRLSQNDFIHNWLCGLADNEKQGIAIVLSPLKLNRSDKKVKRKKISFIPVIFEYKRMLSFILVGVIVGSIIELVFPFLTQIIVDKGIKEKNINFVFLVLSGQMMLIVGSSLVDFFRRTLILKIGAKFSIGIITKLVTKMLRIPVRFFDSKKIGDFIQRLQDHDKVERFVTVYFVDFLFSVITIFILGTVLLIYNRFIFIVFLLGSVLYVTLTYLFVNKKKELSHELFAFKATNQSAYYEIIKGVNEIKLENQEEGKKNEIKNIQTEIYRINSKLLRIDQYISVGNVFINELKNILIIFISAYFVIKGELTLGMMLSIQYITGALNVPITQMLTFFGGYQDAKLSFNRINAIFAINDENDGKLNDVNLNSGNITINHLSFKYVMSEDDILHDINLQIPIGKTTAIVGSSGSGKSTFIKLMLKLYEPTQGTISFNNVNTKDIENQYWHNVCGSVLQDGYIFSGTIKSNIIMGKPFMEESFLHAVSVSNVNSFAENMPYQYETKIGDNGINLSQGQKQRILIARAIYKNPKIFFFDEATNSLDANNEKDIIQKLQPYLESKTVFIVAHRLSTVKNADIILVIDKGVIIEQGSHNTLISKRGYYYKLIKNQLEIGE